MIDPHGEPVRENYRKQGEVRERERIIDLFRSQAERNQTPCEHASNPESGRCGGCHYFIAPEDVIALIKGESNE
jgi:hypothetical protein